MRWAVLAAGVQSRRPAPGRSGPGAGQGLGRADRSRCPAAPPRRIACERRWVYPALAWDHEGRQLAVTNWDGTISLWTIAQQPSWQSVQSHAPSWAVVEAETAASTGNLFAVNFHLRQALRDASPDFLIQLRRAKLLLSTGDFERAMREYSAGLAGGESLSAVRWLDGARAHLLNGDLAGYRRLCEKVMLRFGPSQLRSDNCAPILACILGPRADDLALLLRNIEHVPDISAPTDRSELLFIVGLAHYRAGEWNEAIRCLHQSIEADERRAWITWPVLALAHNARRDRDESRQWLERAENWLKEKHNVGSETEFMSGAALDFRILTREALAVIKGLPGQGSFQNKPLSTLTHTNDNERFSRRF